MGTKKVYKLYTNDKNIFIAINNQKKGQSKRMQYIHGFN